MGPVVTAHTITSTAAVFFLFAIQNNAEQRRRGLCYGRRRFGVRSRAVYVDKEGVDAS